MQVLIGVLVGWTLAALLCAALLLSARRRTGSGAVSPMQSGLYEATATLPHLRRGLSAESAASSVSHLRALTQAQAVALADRERLLAYDGAGADHHAGGDMFSDLLGSDCGEGVHGVEAVCCAHPGCRLENAAVAPLVVAGEWIGSFVALYCRGRSLTADDTKTAAAAASLVSAQLELAELEQQTERLANAELRALRAQISPHFIYNALAAIAGYIRSKPEEARELLTEFAEFTRYAFRGQRPYVTVADELYYVEKYLRLERARFGDRLHVRVQVDPEVQQVVVPVLSLQPLVENAVRHGVERRGQGRIEISGHDFGSDVELRVSDNGVGMEPAHAAVILAGQGTGLGVANVQARLQTSFGPGYGLQIETAIGRGTTVKMRLPRYSAGLRAA
ncbi:MAG: sensor histidine kinase [Solirubrobacteraceae bacterium]